jgi:hypothetical protein
MPVAAAEEKQGGLMPVAMQVTQPDRPQPVALPAAAAAPGAKRPVLSVVSSGSSDSSDSGSGSGSSRLAAERRTSHQAVVIDGAIEEAEAKSGGGSSNVEPGNPRDRVRAAAKARKAKSRELGGEPMRRRENKAQRKAWPKATALRRTKEWRAVAAAVASACTGHRKPCRRNGPLWKDGPNKGRFFWTCAEGERCDFFEWVTCRGRPLVVTAAAATAATNDSGSDSGSDSDSEDDETAPMISESAKDNIK